MLKKRLNSHAGPYLQEANIFNDRFCAEREIRIPLAAAVDERGQPMDFWLSLRGFKVTLGTQITKQSIYEILEYKVVIK